ncbi:MULTISPECIES: hypothetical protein [Jannaschia]|uniref:hypothetical protein n=1 Tax=Jannaschia TaxID=188905 RepID=UPI001C7DB03E|nr:MULTISPECIES: hypothetical protein [unclassified Jannaschia]
MGDLKFVFFLNRTRQMIFRIIHIINNTLKNAKKSIKDAKLGQRDFRLGLLFCLLSLIIPLILSSIFGDVKKPDLGSPDEGGIAASDKIITAGYPLTKLGLLNSLADGVSLEDEYIASNVIPSKKDIFEFLANPNLPIYKRERILDAVLALDHSYKVRFLDSVRADLRALLLDIQNQKRFPSFRKKLCEDTSIASSPFLLIASGSDCELSETSFTFSILNRLNELNRRIGNYYDEIDLFSLRPDSDVIIRSQYLDYAVLGKNRCCGFFSGKTGFRIIGNKIQILQGGAKFNIFFDEAVLPNDGSARKKCFGEGRTCIGSFLFGVYEGGNYLIEVGEVSDSLTLQDNIYVHYTMSPERDEEFFDWKLSGNGRVLLKSVSTRAFSFAMACDGAFSAGIVLHRYGQGDHEEQLLDPRLQLGEGMEIGISIDDGSVQSYYARKVDNFSFAFFAPESLFLSLRNGLKASLFVNDLSYGSISLVGSLVHLDRMASNDACGF